MPSSERGMEKVHQAERAVELTFFEVGEIAAWGMEIEKVLVEVVSPLYFQDLRRR